MANVVKVRGIFHVSMAVEEEEEALSHRASLAALTTKALHTQANKTRAIQHAHVNMKPTSTDQLFSLFYFLCSIYYDMHSCRSLVQFSLI